MVGLTEGNLKNLLKLERHLGCQVANGQGRVRVPLPFSLLKQKLANGTCNSSRRHQPAAEELVDVDVDALAAVSGRRRYVVCLLLTCGDGCNCPTIGNWLCAARI